MSQQTMELLPLADMGRVEVPVSAELVAEVEAALADIDEAHEAGDLEISDELLDTTRDSKADTGKDAYGLKRTF